MAWFQVSFLSECLARSVSLNVLIPADTLGLPAQPGTRKKYRTLYLLHGYFGNYSDWLLKGQIQELSEQFDLAIVTMSGTNGFYVDQPKSGIRGSEFIGRELVEFTRRMFPLSDKREDTLIGGLSMGGYGTLYNAFRYSEVFGHAIALSTPIGLERMFGQSAEPPEMGLHSGYYEALHGDLKKVKLTDRNLELFATDLLDSGRELPDLYLACGYNDMLVYENRSFCEYLKSLGFPYFYEEGPGSHEWAFWRDYLRYGLTHAIPEGPIIVPNPFWIEKDAEAKEMV